LSLAKFIWSFPASPPAQGDVPRVAGGKLEAKHAKVKRFEKRIRSRRRAGAQKIVLRSDFVVVPP
jgi:hypothetical protein